MSLFKNLFNKKETLSEHADVERCMCCGRMKVKGSRLEFISRIQRDGSGTVMMVPNMKAERLRLELLYKETLFTLTYLSISEETYIASDFNSYVVKLKK